MGDPAASSSSRSSKRSVQWDESNLEFLEQTRTPKQKINEPKTPFHQLSLDPEEAGALSPAYLPSEDDAEPAAAGGGGPQANQAAALSAALREVASSSGSRRALGGGRQPSSSLLRTGSTGWTSSEGEEGGGYEGGELDQDEMQGLQGAVPPPGGGFRQSSDFKEHRRKHYDEYRKLRQLGKKIPTPPEELADCEARGVAADGGGRMSNGSAAPGAGGGGVRQPAGGPSGDSADVALENGRHDGEMQAGAQ